MTQRIVSPCVGLCSTTLGDEVCRGCQRHAGEILAWPGYSSSERQARLAELDALRERVAGAFLRVTDAAALEVQLRRHGLRFRDDQPPLSRAVELLRVGRDRIRDLAAYGLAPVGEGEGLSPAALHGRLTHRLLDDAARRRAATEAGIR